MSGTIIIVFFSAMEVGSVFVNNLHTWAAQHILPPSFKLRILYYSKVHVVGFLQHFELKRPSNCEISRWVSRWSVFEHRCSIRRSQRSSPWNGLFVWVTTGVKFSWRHLCVTLLLMYRLKCSDQMKFQVTVKVPISSKFLCSYLILHITQ